MLAVIAAMCPSSSRSAAILSHSRQARQLQQLDPGDDQQPGSDHDEPEPHGPVGEVAC